MWTSWPYSDVVVFAAHKLKSKALEDEQLDSIDQPFAKLIALMLLRMRK